jgi:hypothetical protein
LAASAFDLNLGVLDDFNARLAGLVISTWVLVCIGEVAAAEVDVVSETHGVFSGAF